MEKFSRTIKRIAALAGGAVMVGAALSGALAQLDKLPTPFVTSAGVFDSYVVVGTMGWNPNIAFNAAAASGLAADIAVGIDVGAAFAQRATTAAGASGATVAGGVQVKAAGDDFNYYENAGVLKPNYGSEQLSIFADGNYKDTKGATKNTVTYTQKLTLDPAFGLAIFDKDKSATNEALGSYIKVGKSADAYTYTLKFDSAVSWDDSTAASTMDDWKGTKLTIQGKTYTVSETSGTAPDSITLLAGSQEVTQAYQTEQTYTVGSKSFDVKVNAIAQEGPNAGSYVTTLTINGQSFTALKEGDTVDVDGTTIGINSITYDVVVPTNSQVSFFLGADKLKLVDNLGTVKLNDIEIPGYSVTSDFDSTAGALKSITVTVKPKDDSFLHIGDSWVDPVFGKWQLMYTGLEKSTEDITADVSGQDGTIKLTTLDGKAVTIPVINDDSTGTVYFGDDLIWVDGSHIAGNGEVTKDSTANNGNAMIINDGGVCTATDTYASDCEGLKFMAVSTGGEMRIFEVEKVNEADSQIDVKDLSTGKVYEKLDMNAPNQDIGLISDFRVDYAVATPTTLTFTNVNDYGSAPVCGGSCDIEFKSHKNADLALYTNGGAGNPDQLEFYIQDAHSGGYLNSNYFSFGVAGGGAIDLQLQATDTADLNYVATVKDSKVKQAIDCDGTMTDPHWGVIHTYDTDGKDSYKIEYPEEQVIFDAWMAPVGSAATGAASGAVNVNYINAATGIARTDADFTSAVPTKNVILVGGPAVNELVSDLATANKTALAANYATDTAIVQYITDAFGTNDALVIAGYAAKDTKLAGQVVAANLLQGQFADKMTGAKVTINTAGATTVSGVTFA